MRGSRGRGSDEGSRGPDPNPEQKSADTIEYIENKCDKLIKAHFAFVEDVLDGYICSAFMDYFGMEKLESQAE
uniref:Uncharacterized protein n=1 Tax=Magallana gigas TaxID=29159 RepID=K1PLN5_MAGGI